MTVLVLSHHAEARMSQRGLRPSDLEVILRCGSEIDGDIHDIYFLSARDVQHEIDRLNDEIRLLKQQGFLTGKALESAVYCRKRIIQRLERLKNRKLVVSDKTVVTCYRSNRKDQKRIFRKARKHAWKCF